MARLHRQPLSLATALLVPLLTLATPSWLGASGVGPAWAVLDGLSLGGVTRVPALLMLGWWWGRLGRRAPPIQRSLNLGLLAWIGSVALGLSLILQVLVLQRGELGPWLTGWAWRTTWSQSLITALLAPMLVSIQLLIWRRRAPA